MSMKYIKISLFHLQDELARVFVNLFDAKHLLYQLLWNMFSKEVCIHVRIASLFLFTTPCHITLILRQRLLWTFPVLCCCVMSLKLATVNLCFSKSEKLISVEFFKTPFFFTYRFTNNFKKMKFHSNVTIYCY